MEKSKSITIIFLLVVGLITTTAMSKSASVLLQEGLYAEETEGDLEKAISIYEQVLEQYRDVERLAARATYQLGMCYLKKGEKEKAAEYFEEVVSYYPEQKTVVKKASKQLDKIVSVDDIIARSYVIHYKAVDQSKEALELLNKKHPKGVKTHHANRYREKGETIASICTDNKIGKDKIVAVIHDSTELELVKVVPPVSKGNIFEILGPEVCSYIGSKYGEVCAEAGMKKLYSNSHIYVIDSDFVLRGGGMGYVYNWTGKPITEHHRLSGTSYPDQKLYSISGDEMDIEIVPDKNRSGFYHIYWNPEKPLQPGEFFNYGWAADGSKKLSGIGGGSVYPLTMQNRFGDHAYETFFLAVPEGTILTNKSEEYTNKSNLNGWDIYWWKKEVQQGEDHVVHVQLKKKFQIILKDSFERGSDTPEGWAKGKNVDGVEYIWDKNNGSNGTASLCLKKTASRYFPIAQWTKKIKHQPNDQKLSVAAQIKAENATKTILDALFLDKNDNWIKHEWVCYIGQKKEENIPPANHDWKKYSGVVEIPGNTETIVIGLQIYGPGTVWFDDLEVAYLEESERTVDKQDKLQAEDLTAEGWKLWGQRKLTDAEDKFKKAIAKNPEAEGAYQGLGWAQLNQGKRLNAKDSFEKCIKLNPKNSAALNGLGWIAYGQGNIDQAIQWWEKAVKASNGYATASLGGLTQIYMERKEYDKAEKYYQMWIKAEPNNKDAIEGLKKSRTLQGKPPVSEAEIKGLIKQLGEREEVPFTALNKLIKIGEPAVEQLIAEMMKRHNSNWQFPKALGAIGDARAIGPLIAKWAKNDTAPMNDVIAEALDRITGKDFDKDLQKWQQWWNENKEFYTPTGTIRNFMAAAVELDKDKAMTFVAPDSHDYEDIKEIFDNSENPFNIVFRKLDASKPVKIIETKIIDSMCSAVWRITFREDCNFGKSPFKAGDTYDMDGNLHKYGDKWLITGI